MPENKPKSSFEQWYSDHIARVPFVQKMLFVFHLHTMVKAGLPIVNALQVLSEEIENQKLREVIAEIKQGVEKGQQLSEVLALFPKIFPPLYVNMIAAGEASGELEGALANVSAQMKKSHELTSKIRGAMIYPAVVFTAITGIAIEMVVFVLPKILVMFNEFKTELPLPTRMLMATVKFVGNYGLILLVAIIAFVFFYIWLLKQPKFKKIIHSLNLRWPIFGTIAKKINIARFTLTLSSLLKSGIPIIEAMRITASVLSNVIYRQAVTEISESLKKGESLSSLLRKYKNIFPPMVTEMVMVGEQSGQTEDMLQELSDYFADEVDSTMKNFSTIIEPVIIVVLGLMVAGIAVSVIMPMYTLAQSF